MQCFARAGRVVVAFLIAASGALPALAQDGERAIGEQIATRDCAGCHGLGSAKGVTVEGALVPSFSGGHMGGRGFSGPRGSHSFVSHRPGPGGGDHGRRNGRFIGGVWIWYADPGWPGCWYSDYYGGWTCDYY